MDATDFTRLLIVYGLPVVLGGIAYWSLRNVVGRKSLGPLLKNPSPADTTDVKIDDTVVQEIHSENQLDNAPVAQLLATAALSQKSCCLPEATNDESSAGTSKAAFIFSDQLHGKDLGPIAISHSVPQDIEAELAQSLEQLSPVANVIDEHLEGEEVFAQTAEECNEKSEEEDKLGSVPEGGKTEMQSDSVKAEATKDVVVLEQIEEAKQDGNTHFREGRYTSALDCYSSSLALTKAGDVSLRATLFANMAACYLSLNSSEATIDCACKCIELDENYAKAYLRRSRAYEMMGNTIEAYDDIVKYGALRSSAPASDTTKATAELEIDIERLRVKSEEEKKKMQEEALEKIKDAGNWLLNKVGLSLNDFEMIKKDDGGMSIQMKKRGEQ